MINVMNYMYMCNALYARVYLLEKGMSDCTVTLDFCFSMVTLFPQLPVLPLTFTLSCRNFSW